MLCAGLAMGHWYRCIPARVMEPHGIMGLRQVWMWTDLDLQTQTRTTAMGLAVHRDLRLRDGEIGQATSIGLDVADPVYDIGIQLLRM